MRHDLCALDDLAPGGLTEREAGGTKILLARDGARVFATGATCTHKGAPLKNGRRFGNRVLCPWHHAVFDLETGDHLEPPGKGCLARYRVEVRDGRVLVELPEETDGHRPEVTPEMRATGGERVFAIVGAGAAGLACAEALVKRGFDGRILLITAEDEPPYDRTDLSKTYLQGKTGDGKLPLVSRETLAGLGIELLVATVERVDAQASAIRFADGRTALAFDKCFVAPGSAAAMPEGLDTSPENVLTLRSHADATALKAACEGARTIAIVGSGFIGMEAAAALAQAGKTVTVLSQSPLPFAKQFGEAVAGQILALHRDKGVTVLTGVETTGIATANGRATGVMLKDGREVPADLVIVATGARPRAGLLTGDPDTRSVAVSPTLHVEGDVFAGGDIAEFPIHGRDYATRIEHWRVAEQHGRHAAGAMLGEETPFPGVPFFWSAQFAPIRYVGHSQGFDRVEIVGDLDEGSYTAFYVKDGVVTAALARGKRDLTPAFHVLLMRDPRPSAERLAAVGWDPAALL